MEGVVRKVVGELFGPGGAGGTPGGPAGTEADMEARVRAAVATLRKEEERDGVIEQLKAKVLTERAPVKQRWIEKLMWGVRGDD